MSKQKLSIIFSRKLIRLKYKLVIGVWLIVLATLSIGVAVKSAKKKRFSEIQASLLLYIIQEPAIQERLHI